MRRIDKKEKSNEYIVNETKRKFCIQEMKQWLKSLVIAFSLDLLTTKEHPLMLLSMIFTNNKDRVDIFVAMGHSIFDALLITWACNTGAMNNYCAIAAHTDGNKSHEVETLSMFTRVPTSNIEEYPENHKSFAGYLFFPIHQF